MKPKPLEQRLAARFPGLVFPERASVCPGGLVGYLEMELSGWGPEVHAVAEAALPKKTEPCSECGQKPSK
jgi:hypothetical protein